MGIYFPLLFILHNIRIYYFSKVDDMIVLVGVVVSSATRFSVATDAAVSSLPTSGWASSPTSSPWPKASAMVSP